MIRVQAICIFFYLKSICYITLVIYYNYLYKFGASTIVICYYYWYKITKDQKNNYLKMNGKTSEYLDMVRLKTGLSDYKIAKQYDINQSNLSKYSSGKAALSETHAWLFANILDLDPAEIVANTKLEHALNTDNKSKAKFWKKPKPNGG